MAPATKRGAFPRPQGGCMVLAAKGGIKNGAEGAVPRQRSDTIYLPRAKALNPPVRRSRSQAEPLAPRAKGPAAPSTLAAKPRQPSGIQLPADSLTKSHDLKCRTQQKSTNDFSLVLFRLISSFLSSRAASSQVLSAFVSLTTVFGMGTGVSSQLSPLNR